MQTPITNLFKFWFFLEKKSKFKLFLLLFLILLSALSEIISLALVVPFISIVATPDRLFQIDLINNFINLVGIKGEYNILFFFYNYFCCIYIIIWLS